MQPSLRTDVRVASLETADQYRLATGLYTDVFGYHGSDLGVNANLMSALRKNGGSSIGAFNASGALIGFVYGFAGTDRSGAHFHYSQAAAVHRAHQGRGIGRMLKLAQREVALGWGQIRMRWTFDPVLSRNAFFNLSTLGAEGMRYERDFYDRDDTDRLVVEWDLTRTADPYAGSRTATPPSALAERPAVAVADDGDSVWVTVPREDTTARTLRPHLRGALERALEGRRLVACRPLDDRTSAYLAVPTAEGTAP